MTTGIDSKDDAEPEQRDLGHLLRRVHMPALVRELSRPCSTPLLVLDGHDLTEVSTYGAVAIRSALEAHLARADDNSAVLIEPDHSGCYAHLADLLGSPAAERWGWAGTRSAVRGRDVLVPATVIRDPEDALLITSEAMPAAASALGYDVHTRRLLEEASGAFIANVDEHARSRALAPVIAAAYHPHSPRPELQLVCVNLEDEGDVPITDRTALYEAIMKPTVGMGSINALVALPHGGLDFAVRLMAGTGRGTRFSNRSSDWREGADSFPGFVAGLEIQVSR